jgi:hypothetical protein
MPIEPEELESEAMIVYPGRSYYLEYFMLTIAIIYLINYFVGKEKNKKIANAWLYSIKPVLDANFA